MKSIKGSVNCILGLAIATFMLSACGSSDDYQTISINENNVPVSEEALEAESEAEDIAREKAALKAINPEELFSKGAGVFSWDHLPDSKDIQCMQNNHITEIYQSFKPEHTDKEITDFLKAMQDADIAVYNLEGEAEWSYEAEYQGMQRVLNRVRHLNSMVEPDERIRGIVYDVEPYVLDKWHNIPDQLLAEYTNNIMHIQEECAEDEDHLDICVCIPYSYDNLGHDMAMRKLVKQSDQVFVLNYLKGMEIENIAKEAAVAKYYSKRLVNVYELQPGLLSQTNNTITYYKDGLDSVTVNYSELVEAYPGHDMAIGYHTLEYLKVLSFEE